jgi:hypothetical protein
MCRFDRFLGKLLSLHLQQRLPPEIRQPRKRGQARYFHRRGREGTAFLLSHSRSSSLAVSVYPFQIST